MPGHYDHFDLEGQDDERLVMDNKTQQNSTDGIKSDHQGESQHFRETTTDTGQDHADHSIDFEEPWKAMATNLASQQPARSIEEKLLDECCLSYDDLCHLCHQQQTSNPVIIVRTKGRDNILAENPRMYKHHLLKDGVFRARIIDYYRRHMKYAWCDIVVLNRHLWHIFLFVDNVN